MKKAWERELETMQNAKPVILSEEDQGWLDIGQVEKLDDIMLKAKWHSTVPGSGAPESVIAGAIQDTENMGYDVSAAEELLCDGYRYYDENDLAQLNLITSKILYLLNVAPKVESHPYHGYKMYATFDDYKKDVVFGAYSGFDASTTNFAQKTYVGWLAQICGGAMGTAIEGYTTENIRAAFGEVYGYVRTPNTYNDDITYEIAFLRAIEKVGKDLTSADVAEQWVALVPSGWSAEEFALKNLKLGMYPPESGRLNNPYREWIGAQMRGAICGMVAPGDPREAARYAFIDGVVSHCNNGVLGEVFNAVMVSLAYIKNDIREIVLEAISLIPAKSEYYSVLAFAIESCKASSNWEEAWKPCEKKYYRYNWIHAYPNAAAEVIALWFGNGAFDETMHICAMQGYDVDCNAAQIASVVAIASDSGSIDRRWTDPIGDVLNTYLRKEKMISIKDLTDQTVSVAKGLKGNSFLKISS